MQVVHRSVHLASFFLECCGAAAKEDGSVGLGVEGAGEEHNEGELDSEDRSQHLRLPHLNGKQGQTYDSEDPEDPVPRGVHNDETADDGLSMQECQRGQKSERDRMGAHADDRTRERCCCVERHGEGSLGSGEHVGDDSARVGERRRSKESGEEAADEERLDVLGDGARDVEDGEEGVGDDENRSSSPLFREGSPPVENKSFSVSSRSKAYSSSAFSTHSKGPRAKPRT